MLGLGVVPRGGWTSVRLSSPRCKAQPARSAWIPVAHRGRPGLSPSIKCFGLAYFPSPVLFFFFLRAYPSIQGTLQAAREEKETLLPGGGLMVCCFPHLQLRDLTHPHWGVLQHRNQPALQSTVFPLSLCWARAACTFCPALPVPVNQRGMESEAALLLPPAWTLEDEQPSCRQSS